MQSQNITVSMNVKFENISTNSICHYKDRKKLPRTQLNGFDEFLIVVELGCTVKFTKRDFLGVLVNLALSSAVEADMIRKRRRIKMRGQLRTRI